MTDCERRSYGKRVVTDCECFEAATFGAMGVYSIVDVADIIERSDIEPLSCHQRLTVFNPLPEKNGSVSPEFHGVPWICSTNTRTLEPSLALNMNLMIHNGETYCETRLANVYFRGPEPPSSVFKYFIILPFCVNNGCQH